MNARLVFLALLCVIGVLWRIIGYWRRKAGDAAFEAARNANSDEKRDRYCRLAVLAGHRDACRMFCFGHPDLFEDHPSLKPFKSRGIRMAFYEHYYPSRYSALLNDEQQAFCRSIYQFKEGEIHGIEFFKACMTALQADGKPYHIMFMPCSNWIKYDRRFKRLDWYIGKHRPELTSGLYDVDVFESRESLHEAKGVENRILERNYRIVGDIKGKEVIIIDDILTTGQSVADYKEEIERCGGKVVAAIFYGKTFSMPPLFLIKMRVRGIHISHAIERMVK
ncbi:phosphoribosyltransferase [Parabacteroides distasonis]|uniref:phosphoribosyltransferase n=1 Tax=Bacteroidales TaxID=171549 RepID=UPI001897C33F|nr:phosphoribosyltransferase [Bacteroides uniformis]MBV4225674.1 phosphoribosyltransferase [Parabacteroides distasonis]